MTGWEIVQTAFASGSPMGVIALLAYWLKSLYDKQVQMQKQFNETLVKLVEDSTRSQEKMITILENKKCR